MGSTIEGQVFVRNLAQYIASHEKALANALQLPRPPLTTANAKAGATSPSASQGIPDRVSATQSLAAALSWLPLRNSLQGAKSCRITLSFDPHRLYYLLSQFAELGVSVGPLDVRLEDVCAGTSPTNYVSFAGQSRNTLRRAQSDNGSIHSVSSVRSVLSSISGLCPGLGRTVPQDKTKRAKAEAQFLSDLTYLFSAFTKVPSLRLAPEPNAPFIDGYQEFPFDTAVPLNTFKNVSALEVVDLDYAQFYGWDRLADQLRCLSLKRANLRDPSDMLVGVVLDDMRKKRRHRSPEVQVSAVQPKVAFAGFLSDTGDGQQSSPCSPVMKGDWNRSNILQDAPAHHPLLKSLNSVRPAGSPSNPQPRHRQVQRQDSFHRDGSVNAPQARRFGSGSSNASRSPVERTRSGSHPTLFDVEVLPASKWRFLKHLSLADNTIQHLTASSLAPLAGTLTSLDLSSNLFTEIPCCLATLKALRALNLSNCKIDSLTSLAHDGLPTITALNLNANRLVSLSGIERLPSLERLDLRDNNIHEIKQLARLTTVQNLRELWVMRNPFVLKDKRYRIAIFNLFRTKPSFAEDISLDSRGPGHGEKGQLQEPCPSLNGSEIAFAEPDRASQCDNKSICAAPSARRTITTDTNASHPEEQSGDYKGLFSPGRQRDSICRRTICVSGRTEAVECEPQTTLHAQSKANEPSPTKERDMISEIFFSASSPNHLPSRDLSEPSNGSNSGGRLGQDSTNTYALETKTRPFASGADMHRERIEALEHQISPDWIQALIPKGIKIDMRTVETIDPSPQLSHRSRTVAETSQLSLRTEGLVGGVKTLY